MENNVKVDGNELDWDNDSANETNDKQVPYKIHRSKGKCDVFTRQIDVCVQVKTKPTRNYNGAYHSASSATHVLPQMNVSIRHDIWFQIAMHIEPDDVQRFALICKQTSQLVNTRSFWYSLYRRYCHGSSGWNLKLPSHLQIEEIRSSSQCNTKALRSLVIQALFRCHQKLKIRLEVGYSLDWLKQRIYVSCWQKQYQCLWIMCYKFWNQQEHQQQELHQQELANEVVNDDWEHLANDNNVPVVSWSSSNPHEGVVLLIVVCSQFVPIPGLLSYGQQESRFRLVNTRELLCTDMRAKNLELDFTENTSKSNIVTVKYPRIEKYKVLPWWHPDFQRFIK
ncbi:transmembrane protein 183 [Drosophila tropicalis]|uniref:transmembrane protein 183 n=1 Tax=Drosophila tropicalis TaxID=46794 RepID=UPI0035ABF495